MTFTIPNLQTANHAAEAFPNQTDIDVLLTGIGGSGVLSGCAVTPQGSPNMTVHVAAGILRTSAGNVSVAAADPVITAAASNPRRDLVVADTSGVLSVVAGTPVALVAGDPSIQPVLPVLPASKIALAAVYVAGSTTSVTATDLVDKRVFLETGVPGLLSHKIRKLADESVVNSTTLQNDDDFFFPIGISEVWAIEQHMVVSINAAPDFKMLWAVPAGAAGHWWGSNSNFSTGAYSVMPYDVIATTKIIGTGALASFGVDVYGIIENGSTPGTAQFQWAQFASSGSADTIHKNSILIAERIA